MKHISPVTRATAAPRYAASLPAASNILQLAIDILGAYVTKKSAIVSSS